MKRFCLLILFLIISTSLFAHTLVLKNGKKVEGTLVNEDSGIYQVRDSQGIMIYVKKSQVDRDATDRINQKSNEPKSAEEVSQSTTPRIVTEKTKKEVRVLRKEDLDRMPEVSIIGTEEKYEETPKVEKKEFSETKERWTEEDWKRETRRFAASLRKAEDDVDLLTKECEELGKQAAYALVDPMRYVMINGVWVPIGGSYDASTIQRAQEVCFRADEAKKELSRLKDELEQFQDFARREGALPGWVDPERVR